MNNSKKNSNFGSMMRQVFKKTWWLWIVLILCLLPFFGAGCCWLKEAAGTPWYKMGFLTVLIGLLWFTCSSLTNYFSLQRKEIAITWCQIFILVLIGFWIACFIWTFKIHLGDTSTVVFGIAGALLAWIFQEKVRGALAFVHLRLHHLLCIGDWIKVPKYNVDGEVQHITLTSVTVYNWDTTTSVIPTSVLHSDHFINLQKMAEGKTYGRQMIKAFILDTDHFHVISTQEAEQMRNRDEITLYLPEEDIHEGVLNAQLYRLYLYHWLMKNPHVSQLPRLMVRWLEQKEDGMPLEVYAFIMEGGVTAFEWQQSQIIEHILKSLDWFGLRLYQTLSSKDISENLIQISNKEASGRKENKQ